MGTYRMTDDIYQEMRFCPSTKPGNVVNNGPDGIIGTYGVMVALITPFTIGLGINASAFFFLAFTFHIIGAVLIVVWLLNSYSMRGRKYSNDVLPVEAAYDRLSPSRKAQYKHLVEQAYKNSISGKSNRKIVELFEQYAEIDDTAGAKFIESELRLAKQVKADMLEVERQLES